MMDRDLCPRSGVRRVECHGGPRSQLRPLFELAEDSPAALDAYIDAGRVLVAIEGDEIVGHLQLTETGRDAAEVKNMAVLPTMQGRGVGRALVMAAIERDAFTEDSGYQRGLVIDGIELRDRVWLDRRVCVRSHRRRS
jgi:GNAT superfamily N-acetyltransferase